MQRYGSFDSPYMATCSESECIIPMKRNKSNTQLCQRHRGILDIDKRTRFSVRKSAITLSLDPDEIETAFIKHDGLCDICGEPETSERYERLMIDHDHITGKFRGFLCSKCNMGIGLLGDDPIRLRQAAEYIEILGEREVGGTVVNGS